MNFDDVVTELVERCPGARGAAVFDPDGILVVTAPKSRSFEGLSAEFASVLKSVEQAGREFEHGRLQQLSVFAEGAVVILTSIAAGYFLMLILDRQGLVGRARLLSRLTSERLYAEFV